MVFMYRRYSDIRSMIVLEEYKNDYIIKYMSSYDINKTYSVLICILQDIAGQQLDKEFSFPIAGHSCFCFLKIIRKYKMQKNITKTNEIDI